ncbi:MAG: hypothetical protein IH991_19095 [Planctomycetes bacterium]|nr:hypothetical protein [Planctomycetota bacterium]
MPKFQCQKCDATFELPQETLDRYPGWVPKFCREHSRPSTSKTTRERKYKPKTAPREENLTLAEVLEKYTDGPESGVFTPSNDSLAVRTGGVMGGPDPPLDPTEPPTRVKP